MTQAAKIMICILGILSVCADAQRKPVQSKRIVIAATSVLDGRGRVLHNTRIVIEGSKIVAIDPKAGPVAYDLRGLTVLPVGLMPTHTLPGASVRTGRMPARAREDFPEPEAPSTKRKLRGSSLSACVLRSISIAPLTAAVRPKKMGACLKSKGSRPRNGEPSVQTGFAGGASVPGERATRLSAILRSFVSKRS